METPKTPINIQEITKKLPHRFPFLLVDRVVGFEFGPDPEKYLGRKVKALKNVSINEPYFMGHFPDNPVMPGVLQIEAMAQAGALGCVPGDGESLDVLVAKISNAKFRKPVVPGDALILSAEVVVEKGTILGLKCQGHVDGELVSEVELLAKIFPKS